MKRLQIITVALGAFFACARLQAALYSFDSGSSTISPNPYSAGIPDGDPNGRSFTETISGSSITSISSITVGLNISSVWNGDLYAYLTHNGSSLVVLLNRVGRTSNSGIGSFGSSDTGFNVTLNDAASVNVHNASASPAGGPLTGESQPDGRALNPATVLGTDSPTTSLSSFDNMTANGTWTIYLADMSSGSPASLHGWSLDISSVPEPTNVALAVFGTVLIGAGMVRRWVVPQWLRIGKRTSSASTTE